MAKSGAIVMLLACLMSCVSIYVAPQPASSGLLETDIEKARRALADLRAIGTAIESYAVDNNRYPVVSGSSMKVGRFDLQTASKLAGQIQPIYIRSLPQADPWDRPYLYWSSGKDYVVLSTGADGAITDASRLGGILESVASSAPPDATRSSCLEDDIVFAAGSFVAWPKDPVRRCGSGKFAAH